MWDEQAKLGRPELGPPRHIAEHLNQYLEMRCLHPIVEAVRQGWQHELVCERCREALTVHTVAPSEAEPDSESLTVAAYVVFPTGHTVCAACRDSLGLHDADEADERGNHALLGPNPCPCKVVADIGVDRYKKKGSDVENENNFIKSIARLG